MTKNGLQILVGTKNAGKIKELKELLAARPFQLRGLDEFPEVADVEETGETFAENAVLKAKTYALETGLVTLAEDSGLEVEALDGQPGVFSARYGGENTSYKEKIAKLLDELSQADGQNRRAKFVCSMAMANQKGEIIYLAEGVCRGVIAFEPSGTNGFGYDPIFVPDGFSQTFGELSHKIKHRISHRAGAIQKIIEFLSTFPVRQLDQSHFRL